MKTEPPLDAAGLVLVWLVGAHNTRLSGQGQAGAGGLVVSFMAGAGGLVSSFTFLQGRRRRFSFFLHGGRRRFSFFLPLFFTAGAGGLVSSFISTHAGECRRRRFSFKTQDWRDLATR